MQDQLLRGRRGGMGEREREDGAMGKEESDTFLSTPLSKNFGRLRSPPSPSPHRLLFIL